MTGRKARGRSLPKIGGSGSGNVTPAQSAVQPLIGSPVIRICAKPPRINSLNFPNRLKTRVSSRAEARRRLSIAAAPGSSDGPFASEPPSKLLIGPPVIRIRRNPHRITSLKFPNRLKTPPLAISASNQTLPLAAGRSAPNRNHPLSGSPALIGVSAIRNHDNPSRINHLNFSNRLKMRSFRPGQLPISPAPLLPCLALAAPQYLPNTSAIRVMICSVPRISGFARALS